MEDVDNKRICDECNIEKPIKSFKAYRGYRRRTCKACDNKDQYKKNPESFRRMKSGQRKRNPARAIVIDSRKSDKIKIELAMILTWNLFQK